MLNVAISMASGSFDNALLAVFADLAQLLSLSHSANLLLLKLILRFLAVIAENTAFLEG